MTTPDEAPERVTVYFRKGAANTLVRMWWKDDAPDAAADEIATTYTRAPIDPEPTDADVERVARALYGAMFVDELPAAGVERALYEQAARESINAWRNR